VPEASTAVFAFTPAQESQVDDERQHQPRRAGPGEAVELGRPLDWVGAPGGAQHKATTTRWR
jgi:hypothetical protein